MNYILSQNEYDALTPAAGLQERNEALEIARKLIISDDECKHTHYCSDCKIGQLFMPDDISVSDDDCDRGYKAMNHICTRSKHWPK